MSKMKLTFHGAAGTVTGSNFLLEDDKNKILVDCGLFQGGKISEDKNRGAFTYDPTSVGVLFITHAHLDHIGRIPKLVSDGFRGKIISTAPTREIAEHILIDSLTVLEKDAHKKNMTVYYDEDDIKKAMSLWTTVSYGEDVHLSGGVSAKFYITGHILGSAMIEITKNNKKIVFTGDLGNTSTPLLREADKLYNVDYLVMESVYGDRNHEERNISNQKLKEIVKRNTSSKGVLMIPAFSVERTQELLYEINRMIEKKEIPNIQVFLDSPLAIKVTNVYRKYKDYFNSDIQDVIKSGDDIFNFPGLTFTDSARESKEIKNFKNPKIIIAGAGMSTGGRILYHEKMYLPDPNNTLLIVGYQAIMTLGRKLQSGLKSVDILETKVKVRAKIESITGYSAHRDSDGLFNFVEGIEGSPKKIFLAMGEPKSAMTLAQRLQDYLGLNTSVPQEGDSIELEF